MKCTSWTNTFFILANSISFAVYVLATSLVKTTYYIKIYPTIIKILLCGRLIICQIFQIRIPLNNDLLTRQWSSFLMLQRFIYFTFPRTFSPKFVNMLSIIVHFSRTPRTAFLINTRVVYLPMPSKWKYAGYFSFVAFYNTFASTTVQTSTQCDCVISICDNLLWCWFCCGMIENILFFW